MVGRLDQEGVERLGRRRTAAMNASATSRAVKSPPRERRRGSAAMPEIGAVRVHYSITLGTAKKPCSACGRVGQHLVADIAVGDDILAQAQMVGDHRGHRLDAGGVDLAELLDPAEDVVELGNERLGLGIGRCAMRARLAILRTVAVSTDMLARLAPALHRIKPPAHRDGLHPGLQPTTLRSSRTMLHCTTEIATWPGSSSMSSQS